MNKQMTHWVICLVVGMLIGVSDCLPAQGLDPIGSDFSRGLRQEIKKEIENERFAEIQTPPAPDRLSVFPQKTPIERPFFQHIAQAIQVNSERKKIYAALTQGKSQPLSLALIGFEQCCKIPALWLDRWARKFWKRGIGILINDFMPMTNLKSPSSPPLYRGRLSEAAKKNLQRLLNEFQREFLGAVFRKDFLGAAQSAYQTLLVVDQTEKQEACHLAMVRHFLESFGLSALHSAQYALQSQGETQALSKTFLLVQALPFSTCLWFDLEAQKMHQLDVGILVNDLPAIPFQEEWKAFIALSHPKDEAGNQRQ